jgi:ribosome maturation factor RimP
MQEVSSAVSTDRHAELVRRVEAAAARAALAEGVELVEVSVRGPSRKRLVRVDIDRVGTAGVGLADCKRVSDALGRILDEDDVIPGSYVLEVSSPGTDRPIRTAADLRRNTGRRLVVTTAEPIGGRREFRGLLVQATGDSMTLQIDDREAVEIPLERIANAHQDIGF